MDELEKLKENIAAKAETTKLQIDDAKEYMLSQIEEFKNSEVIRMLNSINSRLASIEVDLAALKEKEE